MTAEEAVGLIGARTAGGNDLKKMISGGFVCDIMSLSMAQGFRGMAWITHRADMNALAVAVMKGAACLIFPAGIVPEADVTGRAEQENMPLLLSEKTAFEIAARLHEAGLCGGEE